MSEYVVGAKDQEQAEAIVKSRVALLTQLPFYGTLLSNLTPTETQSIDTLATDGKRILYNPDFTRNLTQKQLNFIMVHEVLHVALGHLWRQGVREPRIWNIAIDYVVNDIALQQMAIKSGYLERPSMGVFDDEKKYTDMNAEQIYTKLTEQPPLENQTAFDTHELWCNIPEKDIDKLKNEWQGHVLAAAEKAEPGTLPGDLETYIKNLRQPQVDWRELIHATISFDPMDYSYQRTDTRFTGDILMPAFCELDTKAQDVLWMNDTSGSVSQEEQEAMYSEIIGAIDQYGGKIKGYIGFFDGGVTEPKPIETVQDVLDTPAVGGGGTSFDVVLNFIAEWEKTHTVNTVIISTDGYCDFPSENPVKAPLVWLMTTDIEPPYGKVAHLNMD